MKPPHSSTAERIAYDEPICRAKMRPDPSRAGQRASGAALPATDPAGRSRAAAGVRVSLSGFTPREILLAAAARAVLAAFREPLEERRLTSPATATLRLLETALEPYDDDNGGRAARQSD